MLAFVSQDGPPHRILQNLCHLFKADGLQSLLCDRGLDQKINLLFIYFSAINFAQDQVHLEKIKSLPLFKDINGTYRSLKDAVYVWPNHICMLGKEIWMKQILEDVVFLTPGGAWTKLGTSMLKVEKMSPLVFYIRYIFLSFCQLNEQDRLEHLKHIRDTPQLFDAAWYDSKVSYDDPKKEESAMFVDSLCHLPCLWKKDQLRPISDFYDPTIIIFGLFLGSHEFPPEGLCDETWLQFFCKIRLKTNASKEEFISFCKTVANGGHKHTQEASRALLDYLFEERCWHGDISFLSQVSEVPFVCAKDLKDLAWIAPVANVEKVVQQGSKAYRLTSLGEAVSRPAQNLVWTVKPVVELPNMPYYHSHSEAQQFSRNLRICVKPAHQDVLRNVINISKSRFAKFELFDVYPESCTQQKGKEHLLCKVLYDYFTDLRKTNCSQVELGCLEGVACIPVSRDGTVAGITSPVLVTPLQVIASNSKDITKLVPFLNPLPNELYSVLNEVLSKIGVKCDIEVNNIQHAFQTVFDNI